MAPEQEGLRGRGRRWRPILSPPPPARPPTMGNFMGVVTRETRRLRPRPPPPPSAPRPKVPAGGVGRCCGPRRSDLGVNLLSPRPLFEQMSPVDELEVRSRPPPPSRAAPRGWGAGTGDQAPPTLRPAGFSPHPPDPANAAAWGPSPGTGRPASGDPARQPSRPSGGRPAPTGPPGFGPRPAKQAWGWSWLPGTPREVKSFSLRGAEVHALTPWAQSFDSHHPH